LRHITGHRLKPTVQQQHRQPQRSHFPLTGNVFFKQVFTLLMLVLNSSGATWKRRGRRREDEINGQEESDRGKNVVVIYIAFNFIIGNSLSETNQILHYFQLFCS
jgi:hypothetical protein